MTRWAPAKADILDELAAEIRHNYARGRIVVAVDGIDGSGSAPFADDVAEAFERAGVATLRASVDGFLRSGADGISTASDFYAAAYDGEALRDRLIRPFRAGNPVAPGAGSEAKEGPTGDAVLVVDGPFLLRPELIGLWNWTICLFVPADEAFERAGTAEVRREAQRLYLHRVQPRVKAIANVDNTDPDHPRRTFSDSC